MEPIVERSDEAIVRESVRHPDLFAVLVERYEEKLKRYVRRMTNVHPEEIADLVQDIFVKVYLNLNGFDPKLKFSSWLYRIAHNEIISQARKRNARPQVYIDINDESIIDHFAADIDLTKERERADLRQAINTALGKIENKYREVLILQYFEEKSYEEIADIIKKPTSTVGTLARRGKEQLKKYLII